MASSPQYLKYSVREDDDDTWSRLESLQVFTSASRAPSLDLVDVTTTLPQQVLRKTFTSTKDLEDYIDQASIVGCTRYM